MKYGGIDTDIKPLVSLRYFFSLSFLPSTWQVISFIDLIISSMTALWIITDMVFTFFFNQRIKPQKQTIEFQLDRQEEQMGVPSSWKRRGSAFFFITIDIFNTSLWPWIAIGLLVTGYFFFNIQHIDTSW